MNDDLRRAVLDLRNAIRETLTVFDLQHAQGEAARQQAEASRAAFDRLMESYQSGRRPTEAERSRTLMEALGAGFSVDRVQEEARASAVLARRWEAAFCDMYEALIRLNAHPDARAGVAPLAAQIRAIRLLQVEQDDMELLPLPDLASGFGGPPEAADELSFDEFRSARAGRMRTFMSGMDEHYHPVSDSLVAKAHLTRRHLEEVLAAAEALASRLR